MKVHLVTGGCGFVGRNMVKHLLKTTENYILMVDDLSSGIHPEQWLNKASEFQNKNINLFQNRLLFIKDDVRTFFREIKNYDELFKKQFGIKLVFQDVFHFAAVVGGRVKIENDPLAVAIDLSIDAEFFNWASKALPERILYPSSSAAYPVSFQTKENHRALKETDINFEIIKNPDLTYGWSKLTGEYLAQLTAQKFNVKVTCIRPFSGYGEDQDLNYPVPAIAQRIAKKQDPIEVWGDGTQSRDFVHIDDVIECSLKAMNYIHDGSAVNIGSGFKTNFLEVINLLSEIAGYSPKIKRRLEKPVGVHSRYSNIELAKNKLGWQPQISLKSGLERVLNKMLENLNSHKYTQF